MGPLSFKVFEFGFVFEMRCSLQRLYLAGNEEGLGLVLRDDIFN